MPGFPTAQEVTSQELDSDIELELLARAEHVRVIFRHSSTVLLSRAWMVRLP